MTSSYSSWSKVTRRSLGLNEMCDLCQTYSTCQHLWRNFRKFRQCAFLQVEQPKTVLDQSVASDILTVFACSIAFAGCRIVKTFKRRQLCQESSVLTHVLVIPRPPLQRWNRGKQCSLREAQPIFQIGFPFPLSPTPGGQYSAVQEPVSACVPGKMNWETVAERTHTAFHRYWKTNSLYLSCSWNAWQREAVDDWNCERMALLVSVHPTVTFALHPCNRPSRLHRRSTVKECERARHFSPSVPL